MDWINFATGAALGTVASSIFFAGLALSVRAARRAIKPCALILGSTALRIALLLLAGWSVAQLGTWSGIGFASAFLFVRYAAIVLARIRPVREGA